MTPSKVAPTVPLHRLFLRCVPAALALAAAFAAPPAWAGDGRRATSNQFDTGYTIPYEGFLMLDNTPMSGSHVLRIELWGDASSTATSDLEYAETQTVMFYNGSFTLAVGEGTDKSGTVENAVRDGDKLFLAIQVQDAANAFIPLSGRQTIEPVPFAAWSASASNMTVDGDLTVLGDTTLARGTVGASEIEDDSVGNLEMANNAIGTLELQSNAVTQAKMADNSVGSPEIINNSLSSADIGENAIGVSELNVPAMFTTPVEQQNSSMRSVSARSSAGLAVASNTITVPTSGSVLAIASCNYRCGSCSSSNRHITALVDIGTRSTGSVSSGNRMNFEMRYNGVSANITEGLSIHDVFPVGSGTHSFYVRTGHSQANSINYEMRCHLSTIFLPH